MYSLGQVTCVFAFLAVPGVGPTNNRAERALRVHVVQRRIMGCFRNGKGTWIYETVMTLLATWKQRDETYPKPWETPSPKNGPTAKHVL
ncbi:transposase [Candidatus Bathyarchaeota archaeon]|nr:transposase [Candidatus Bathyarchaeota archaeon]